MSYVALLTLVLSERDKPCSVCGEYEKESWMIEFISIYVCVCLPFCGILILELGESFLEMNRTVGILLRLLFWPIATNT